MFSLHSFTNGIPTCLVPRHSFKFHFPDLTAAMPGLPGSICALPPTELSSSFLPNRIPRRALERGLFTRQKISGPRKAAHGPPTTNDQRPKPDERAQPYRPAPAPVATMPAICIPSIRSSTLSALAPVSVQASTYGCLLPSACITSTATCACAFFTT